jgi:hypothetical protein
MTPEQHEIIARGALFEAYHRQMTAWLSVASDMPVGFISSEALGQLRDLHELAREAVGDE